MTRYLSAMEKMSKDDFDVPFTMAEGEIIYDAKTNLSNGCWATMTEMSWQFFGAGKLGQGFGQKYRRNVAGELHKVEG